MLKQFSIATRIALGFVFMLLFLIIIAGIGLFSQQRLHAVTSDLLHHTLRYSLALEEVRYEVGNLRRFEKDMLLNIAAPDKVADYLQKWEASLKNAQDSLARADAAARPEQRAALAELGNHLVEYGKGIRTVHADIIAGKLLSPADGNAAVGQYKEAVRKVGEDTTTLTKAALEATSQIDTTIDVIQQRNAIKLLIASTLALLLAIAAATFITLSIRKPLQAMQETILDIDQTGHIGRRMPISGKDEVAQTSTAMNRLLSGMCTLIGAAKQNSGQLNTASQELASASSQVSAASNAQSEAASSTAAAIEQLAVSVQLITDNAHHLEEDARSVAGTAATGSDRARLAADEILQIAEAIGHSTVLIGKLNQRSDEIGSIAMVIKDIADQTNLLALNAAIEAARAGELGRGFAVVADEVRKLAERTTQATVEITSKIKAVQHDTAEAAQGMNQASSRVDQGVESTQEVASALGDIENKARSTVSHVESISTALKEQSIASQDIARHVERIAQASEENSQAARSTNQLSHRLTTLASELDKIIQHYKT
ncbi:methyl-accepting chemotaxis protein [Chitinilyticum litopenaei]|uniref:methyl-accepting chemotaxis protein n=1 Tax=Chitinilyticum litopenaei TaxID=1121276 RepID=UPI00049095A6|nr:HAMP domain-containing methyl-accepting chemotaxis protein [Chitinilyticum litopenaei]